MSTIKSLLNTSLSPTPTPSSSPSLSSATPTTNTNSNSNTATPSPTSTPRLLPALSSSTNNHPLPLPTHHTKPKPKIIKDAPVFTPGPTRGPVRFPPFVYPIKSTNSDSDSDEDEKESVESTSSSESSDEDAEAEVDPDTVAHTTTKAKTSKTSSRNTNKQNHAIISHASLETYHSKFSLNPRQTSIAAFPRHIPYNSEKRIFLDKTGRDFFEVFQYTFKIPGCGATAGGGGEKHVGAGGRDDDKEDGGGKMWTMLWDYNTGLVRTTPLFKCCGYGKTTPAKMLNKNVGLRDICHSITGGALVAQGYWIPHLAAKHIAATFCFSIRHALTPVFGLDFIDLCVPPSDPRFGSMLISEEITRQCAAEARGFKEYEALFPSVRPVLAGSGGSRAGSPARSRAGTPVLGKGEGEGVSAYDAKPKVGRGKKAPPTMLRFKAVNDPYVLRPSKSVKTLPDAAGHLSAADGGSDVDTSPSTHLSDADVDADSESYSRSHAYRYQDGYLISPTTTNSTATDTPICPRAGNVTPPPVFRDVFRHLNVIHPPRSTHPFEDDLPSPKSAGRVVAGGGKKRKYDFESDIDEESYWKCLAAGVELVRSGRFRGSGGGGTGSVSAGQSPKMRKLMRKEDRSGVVPWGGRGVGGREVRGEEGDGDTEMGYEAENEGEGEAAAEGGKMIGKGRRYHSDATAAVSKEEGGEPAKEFGEKEAAKALLSLWGVRKVVQRRASA